MTIQRGATVWESQSEVERDTIGTDIGLRVGDICNVRGTGLFRCDTAGAASSTWVAIGSGGGGSGHTLSRIPKDVNSLGVWDFDRNLDERDGAPALAFASLSGTPAYWPQQGLYGVRVPNGSLQLRANDPSFAINDLFTIDYMGYMIGGDSVWALGTRFSGGNLSANMGFNPAMQFLVENSGGINGIFNTTLHQDFPVPHLFSVTYDGGTFNYYVDGVLFQTGALGAIAATTGVIDMWHWNGGQSAGGSCIGFRVGSGVDDAATILQRARDVGLAP